MKKERNMWRLRWLVVGLAVLGWLGAAQAGTKLDKKFGVKGVATTSFGDFSGATALARQSDGKLVVVGYTATNGMSGYDYDFALARYNPDGSLDTTFDGDGKVTTDFGTNADIANAVAIQPSDGKIVVAGFSNLQMAVARYDTNGALDPDFGTGGKQTVLINSNCKALAVAIQPNDEKIVLAGNAFTGSGNNFALARLGTDGEPDDTFGTDGVVSVHFTALPVEFGNALALQGNGKIVVAGQAYSNLDGTLNDFLVARYSDTGTPDSGFGTGGATPVDFNLDEEAANAVVIQRDDKIVVGGFTFQNNGYDLALARLDTAGDLDSTFGSGGKATLDLSAGGGDHVYTMLIQPGTSLATDKIVVAGDASLAAGYAFALARFSIDGVLDRKFGKKGVVITPFGADFTGHVEGLLRQPDGMLVAAGTRSVGYSSSTAFAVTRYKTK